MVVITNFLPETMLSRFGRLGDHRIVNRDGT